MSTVLPPADFSPAGFVEPTADEIERYRGELLGFCYRMLGSVFEADDAVQETMIRAWRGSGGFEGRSGLRTWLYRIAAHVCVDMLRGRGRRAVPMDLGPAAVAPSHPGEPDPVYPWVSPVPDARLRDPADVAVAQETIRLAFVAALQHLPPRQRVVLILREVLGWPATEVAELIGASVPAVNSATQRARATLAARDPGDPRRDDLPSGQRALLAAYVDAFQRYDMETLVSLLREDAIQSMPPYAMWLRGAGEIAAWMLGPGRECRGSRLRATSANGSAAFGQYRRDGRGGYHPWALQVLTLRGGRIAELHFFLDTNLFAKFGLPGDDFAPAAPSTS